MADCRFWTEFNEITKDEYIELIKFRNSSFNSKTNTLTINFIIDSNNYNTFIEESLPSVKETISKMFDGLNSIEIKLIKTFSDESAVKQKIIEFLNNNSNLLLNAVESTKNSIVSKISDKDIIVEFRLSSTYISLFSYNDGILLNKLSDFLDNNFNKYIDIKLIDNGEEDNDEDIIINTQSTSSSKTRLITVKTLSKVFAKSGLNSVAFKPNYIKDIKDACDDVVLCGKVSNITKGEYNNKNYDPNDPKKGPEKKPLVRFLLDDTTSKISCTSFVKEDQVQHMLCLPENSEVICQGKISLYSKTNVLSFIPHSVFRCEIDYSSIHVKENKPVPEIYTSVFPSKYVDTSTVQTSFFDTEDVIPEFFNGKSIVVFDLETTGLSIQDSEIIEIGAIKVIDGIPTEIFSTYVKPLGLIPNNITQLTGITNDMVFSAPKIEEVLPDFCKFISGSIICGHNIKGFDYPFVKKYADELGYDVSSNDVIDTEDYAKKYLSGFTKYNLVDLCKMLKIDYTNAHRAYNDSDATFKLLKEIAKKMQ